MKHDLELIEISVDANRINIKGAINLTIDVDKKFKYLGHQKIFLGDKLTAHQYIFIVDKEENDKNLITHSFFIQYEYFNQGAEGFYNYSSDDRIEIGERTWIRDNFLFNCDPQYQDEDSDTNQMNKFYNDNGYETVKYVRNNRLVTMIDEEKRHELLVIYKETVSKDYLYSFVENDEIIEEKWQPVKEDLKEISLRQFKIKNQ